MRQFLTIFVFLVASVGFGQTAPTPKPDDVKSIDAIVAALYDVISGPPGAKHDWDRMRSLFSKDARMSAVSLTRSGALRGETFTVEDYIRLSGASIEKIGFFEKEIGRKAEQFANIAHIFSTYESRIKAPTEKPFARGINSIQVWNDGKRWWIVSILWQDESPATPLPAKYLKGGARPE